MSYIEIQNSITSKCKNCDSIFLISNSDEYLFRNILIIYIDKKKNIIKLKCKQCKEIIIVNNILK